MPSGRLFDSVAEILRQWGRSFIPEHTRLVSLLSDESEAEERAEIAATRRRQRGRRISSTGGVAAYVDAQMQELRRVRLICRNYYRSLIDGLLRTAAIFRIRARHLLALE